MHIHARTYGGSSWAQQQCILIMIFLQCQALTTLIRGVAAAPLAHCCGCGRKRVKRSAQPSSPPCLTPCLPLCACIMHINTGIPHQRPAGARVCCDRAAQQRRRQHGAPQRARPHQHHALHRRLERCSERGPAARRVFPVWRHCVHQDPPGQGQCLSRVAHVLGMHS